MKYEIGSFTIIGCKPHEVCKNNRIDLFRDEDVNIVIEKLKTLSEDFLELDPSSPRDDLYAKLEKHGLSVYGHGDLINELIQELTAGE